jgi:hypothetical protein
LIRIDLASRDRHTGIVAKMWDLTILGLGE